MADLRHELQQLSPSALRELLSASGHGQLLRDGDATQPSTVAAVEQLASVAKDDGNAFFRQNRLKEAVAAYSRCIEMDPSHAVCLSNRAAAYLKLNELKLAAADCSKAIEVAPSIKPFMRRAVAYIGLQQYTDAVADLTAALKFEPRNKECYSKLHNIVEMVSDGTTSELRHAAIRAALILSVRDGWTQYTVRGNPGPGAVNGHTLFIGPNGRIYLFGGRAVWEQKPQVFALDETDNSSWDTVSTQGTDVPSSRAWHSTSAIGKTASGVYCVYGGVSSRGEDSSVYLLVPVAAQGFRWRLARCLQDEKEIPAARSGHSAVSVVEKGDQVVYIFGGRTKQGVSDQLLVLRCLSDRSSDAISDLVDGTIIWSQVNACGRESSWPAARDGHSMCLLHGTRPRLVVFGGNGQLNDERMNDVWVFDLQQQRWTLLECSGDLPPPRSYHTAHVVNEFLFVVGGRTATSEDASVYMLDINSSQWFKVPLSEDRALTPRAWHSSVLTEDGKVFVLGGGTYHGPLKGAAALDLSFFQAKTCSLNRHSVLRSNVLPTVGND